MQTTIKNTLVKILTHKTIEKLGRWVYGHSVPIFMLHRIHDHSLSAKGVSAEHLHACLQHLVKNGFTFLSLEEMIRSMRNQQALPERSVVFTMDDGFSDQLEIAAPIFSEFNCPATLFLITGMLDNKLWPWDNMLDYAIFSTTNENLDTIIDNEHISLPLKTVAQKHKSLEILRTLLKATSATQTYQYVQDISEKINCAIPEKPPTKYRPITWDQAREFEKQGILFSPHTISHRILSKLDDLSAEKELIYSWQRLNDELEHPSPVFCYPTGRYCDYGPREIEILIKHGFIGAVSTIPAQTDSTINNNSYFFNLPRLSVGDDLESFTHDASWLGHARNKTNPVLKRFHQ